MEYGFLMNKNHVEFIGAKSTTEFLRILDALFDYYNSLDPYRENSKATTKKKKLMQTMIQRC